MPLQVCKCVRCGYEWAARFGVPKRCPNHACRSFCWNRARLPRSEVVRRDALLESQLCHRCRRVGQNGCANCPGWPFKSPGNPAETPQPPA